MVLTLQLEHLVHQQDGKIMMQKWQWHGKYVLPKELLLYCLADRCDSVWLVSNKNVPLDLYQWSHPHLSLNHEWCFYGSVSFRNLLIVCFILEISYADMFLLFLFIIQVTCWIVTFTLYPSLGCYLSGSVQCLLWWKLWVYWFRRTWKRERCNFKDDILLVRHYQSA